MNLLTDDYAPTRIEPPARVVPVIEGKVRLRLGEYMIEKGYVHTRGQWAGKPRMTILQKLTGINYSTLNNLVNYPDDVASISFPVFAKLCAALQCQPGDLLVYERPRVTIHNYQPPRPEHDYETETTLTETRDGETLVSQW